MTGSIQSQALGGLTQTMQFIRHCELVFEWVYYNYSAKFQEASEHAYFVKNSNR